MNVNLYHPQSFEKKWIECWKKGDFFAARIEESKKSFVMIHPAPNITGNLHMGHALNIILQDVLMRYYRLKGFNTIWFPGADHGGIATQNVIENRLILQNKTRVELGKKAFLDLIWQWKDKIIPIMHDQILALGASPDFHNEYFTMDEIRTRGVKEAFIRLYNEGLIYKENGIVNWCPRCETALSEMELNIRQEKQKFYLIKYKIKNSNQYILVMTARPETIRADVALAVNPADARYKDLIGQSVITPIYEKEIPVIAESYVTSTFGEGAVRVTPGHVPYDFVLAKKYNLPVIIVIDKQGILMDVNEDLAGMERMMGRAKIIIKLKKKNLLMRIEEHLHGNGYCYRCNTLIEPYPLEQWYLKIDQMIDQAIQLVEDCEVDIQPESYKDTFCNWMRSLKKRNIQREHWWEGSCVAIQMGFSSNKDWCISRQIWWGHEIPAWKCTSCNHFTVSSETPKACSYCSETSLIQEKDVLDMWFSCALWPLTVMGWPEDTFSAAHYFPQTLAVTGYDVLYFWVVPTIMLITHLSGKKPYDRVLLHGLVCDQNGKKMSKSFGNVINPDNIIDKYGSDTLRLTLASKVSRNFEDIKIAEVDFIEMRKKIETFWKLAHELEDLLNQCEVLGEAKDNARCETEEAFEQLVQQVSSAIENYQFKDAVDSIFSSLLQRVEEVLMIIKHQLQESDHDYRTILEKLMATKSLFRRILIILHPFIPFVTEELWEKMNYGRGSLLEVEWQTGTLPYAK